MEHRLRHPLSRQVILDEDESTKNWTTDRNFPCKAAPRGFDALIDYGRERIGLAIARANAKMAQPLSTLRRINRNEDMRRLRELAREHRV